MNINTVIYSRAFTFTSSVTLSNTEIPDNSIVYFTIKKQKKFYDISIAKITFISHILIILKTAFIF